MDEVRLSKLWLFEFKYYNLASAAKFCLSFTLKKVANDRDAILTFKCQPTQLGNGGKSGSMMLPQLCGMCAACAIDD